MNIEHLSDIKEQRKACVLSLWCFALVSLNEIFEVILARNLASVSDREIVILQIVIVFLCFWLTIWKRHNEEVRLKLLNRFPLHDHRRNHFVESWFSQHHLFSRFWFTEDVVSLERLALIWNHVSFYTDLLIVSFGLNYDCNEFWNFVTFRMFNFELFLILSNLSYFLRCQECVLIDGCKNPAYSL